MKIVLINNLFKPFARGGAERVFEIIAEGLARRGHEVVVVSSRPCYSQAPSSKLQASNNNQVSNIKYQIYYFYFWNIISYYNLGKIFKPLRLFWHLVNIFNLQSYFKIKQILQAEKPDVVLTHNLMGVGFLTPLAIRKNKIKWTHTLHDIQLIHPAGLMIAGEEKKVDSFVALIYQKINKKLFGSPNVVISPSRWLLDQHVKKAFFKDAKKVILTNPTSDFSRDCRAPTKVGTRDDSFIFLYVGQLEKHKGVELLIDAFKSLKKEDVELLIVGDGGEVKNLKFRIKNDRLGNVKILDRKSREEVQELMQKTNCLVVPSICYENSPTVIMEAYAQGVPVIASDIGGIPEILEKKFLFKAGDIESLKNKMQWAIDKYAEIKDAASKVNKENNSADSYIEKLLKL